MRIVASYLAFAILLNLCGCVFIPEGRHVNSGYKPEADALAFLEAPDATRDEAVATLGAPTWESRNARVLLYLWTSSQRWLAIPSTIVVDDHLPFKPYNTETSHQRWALLIKYDESGKVGSHVIRQIGHQPLEEVCLAWAKELAGN